MMTIHRNAATAKTTRQKRTRRVAAPVHRSQVNPLAMDAAKQIIRNGTYTRMVLTSDTETVMVR